MTLARGIARNEFFFPSFFSKEGKGFAAARRRWWVGGLGWLALLTRGLLLEERLGEMVQYDLEVIPVME